METYDGYNNPNAYYGTTTASHDDTARAQIEQLKAEVEVLKTEVQQYKTVSQSFEKRVLDLRVELMKKDEEIARLKEQGVAGKESDQNSEGIDSEVLRKLFVGGLNFTTTDEMLQEYFSQYGTVQECTVMKDPATKKSRGFGFVVFATSAMLDAAQDARPHTIDNRQVDTKRAMPRGGAAKRQPGILAKKIFIGGLKTTTEADILNEYFSQFGVIDHVEVLEDKASKRKRGFAYVTFNDSDPVDKAVLQQYHVIDGRRCEVKKAFTREEMKNKNSHLSGPPGPHSPGQFPGGFGMGNFCGDNPMGGGNNPCGPHCGGHCGGPNRNMGGNFGPVGNMCGNMGGCGGGNGGCGPGGNFGMGGKFGPGGGNMCGGHCGNGGGMRGNRGGEGAESTPGPNNWGSGGGNMGGFYGGDNTANDRGLGGGSNQSNNFGWNQDGGYLDGAQGMNWKSGGNASASGISYGKGATGKPMRNTYAQRGAGPYGGGYGVTNTDAMGQEAGFTGH